MDFDLSPDQKMFREAALRFGLAIDVPARQRQRCAVNGYTPDRWREAAELGLLALPVSEGEGGLGGSMADLSVVAMALGEANAPDPWLENGVLPLRLLAGSDCANVRAAAVAGETVVAAAFAEPEGRYRLEPQSTRCERRGSDLALTGTKTFVLGGAMADWLLVSARIDATTRILLVNANAPGVSRRAYRVADGSIAAEVTFAEAVVKTDALLPLDISGFHTVIATTRLLASAEMVGLTTRLLEETLAYVKERQQFGLSIGSFQAVQHRLVDCYVMLEQARSMVWHTTLAEQDEGWTREVAGAKAFVAERAEHIGREAVQLHGGMGVTDELAIGHMVKRVLLLARLFGDVDADLATYARAA